VQLLLLLPHHQVLLLQVLHQPHHQVLLLLHQPHHQVLMLLYICGAQKLLQRVESLLQSLLLSAWLADAVQLLRAPASLLQPPQLMLLQPLQVPVHRRTAVDCTLLIALAAASAAAAAVLG
jgi:hypothetical protein